MRTHLTCIDPQRGKARFYTIIVSSSLWGEWSVIREWGRLGQGGTVRMIDYPCEHDALSAAEDLRRQQLRRGYRAC